MDRDVRMSPVPPACGSVEPYPLARPAGPRDVTLGAAEVHEEAGRMGGAPRAVRRVPPPLGDEELAVVDPQGGLTAPALLLGAGTAAANVLAYVTVVVLARATGPVVYGELAALVALGLIGNVPATALQLVVARRTAAAGRPRPDLRGLRAAAVTARGLLGLCASCPPSGCGPRPARPRRAPACLVSLWSRRPSLARSTETCSAGAATAAWLRRTSSPPPGGSWPGAPWRRWAAASCRSCSRWPGRVS